MADRWLDVWTDTISKPLPCGDPACRKPIVFAVLVKSGKRHPFVADFEQAAMLFADTDTTGVQRHVTKISQASSHFADCPGAKRFSRRG